MNKNHVSRKLKRNFAMAMAVAMAAVSLSTAVCAADAPEVDTSRNSTATSDERYDKVTVALPSDPVDLGPTGYGDNSALYTMMNYYENLFDFRDNTYVPILAKG